METPAKPSFKEAVRFWLKLGFISFGGPAGQIAIMHEFLVTRKKWISESRFLHALNYCMILPGPEAQQFATYIGWLLHGTWGGIVAGVLFILPSLFILLGLSIVYVLYGTLPWVAALLYGLKPAVIAIILLALIKISKKSLISPLHYGIAATSFILIVFFQISFPLIILGAMLIGFIAYRFKPSLFQTAVKKEEKNADELSYFLNRYSPTISNGFSIRSIARKTIVGLLLWAAPLILFYALSTDFPFWKNLSFFFSKAALVTFGGAYAVLPYVAQVSVEKFHWLSASEMIDGLALGETTPGPLIMILVFVGFLGGFHHSHSLAGGTLALITTAYYTFLPSFLFILIGAPLVEATQENTMLKAMLSVVTASIVGVILNLTFYFGQSVLFQHSSLDWFALVWLLISFLALYRFKFNMIGWIGLSAAAGFIYQYIR